jgi:hypothetical protein
MTPDHLTPLIFVSARRQSKFDMDSPLFADRASAKSVDAEKSLKIQICWRAQTNLIRMLSTRIDTTRHNCSKPQGASALLSDD